MKNMNENTNVTTKGTGTSSLNLVTPITPTTTSSSTSSASQCEIFNHPEFGNLRCIEIDGEPWFVGKDVATALGYNDATKAVRSHVEKEDKIMGGQNGSPSITDNGLSIQFGLTNPASTLSSSAANSNPQNASNTG